MFGGVSFIVNDKIVVAARNRGNLLVRIDPERSRELLARPDARPAEMGKGCAMGRGWLDIPGETLDGSALSFWIGVALEYNSRATGS